MKTVVTILVTAFLATRIAKADPEDAEVRQTRLAYLKVSGIVLDLCVYEQQYVAPKDGVGAGSFIRRAVVTGVHKGNVKVGAKIEIVETVVYPPVWLPKFKSVVEGELLTYCYYGEELPAPKEGRHVVDHNQQCFDRCMDEDVKAFVKELDSKASRTTQSEQDAAGQPATRPEAKSEGVQKPQPQSERRSR